MSLLSRWTLLTSCFSHEDTSHIVLNLINFVLMAPAGLQMLGNARCGNRVPTLMILVKLMNTVLCSKGSSVSIWAVASSAASSVWRTALQPVRPIDGHMEHLVSFVVLPARHHPPKRVMFLSLRLCGSTGAIFAVIAFYATLAPTSKFLREYPPWPSCLTLAV